MLTLVLVLLSIILITSFILTNSPKSFPPGPTKFPFIGSISFMFDICEITKTQTLIHAIFKNVDKYGKIFGFYMGSQPFVVIADYDILREVMKNESMCDRQDMTPVNEYRPGHWTLGNDNKGRQPGITFSQGNYWKEQRRFFLRNLRDFGFGKSEMETTLAEEVEKLCDEYSKFIGVPFCLDNTLNLSVVNSLWAILTGEKLDLRDKKLLKMVSLFNKTVKNVKNIGNLFLALTPPWCIRKNPLFDSEKNSGLDIWKEALQSLSSILEDQVKAHKLTSDDDSNRDMMDLYLNQIKSTHDLDSSFYQERGHFAMINGFIDLFIAGMETTSSSLLWTFLYMLHHPDIKNQIHEELDQVVGRDETPCLQHMENLHYTNATLHESMRLSCVVYNGVNHCASDDIVAGDYVIPKGCVVIPSLMNVMLDPDHFNDPMTFNPKRFLTSDGIFKSDERVIPFSTGKRYCLGKSLAEKELFLFFTGIMSKFDIQTVPNTTLPSYHMKDYYSATIVRSPPSFDVILKHRK